MAEKLTFVEQVAAEPVAETLPMSAEALQAADAAKFEQQTPAAESANLSSVGCF